LHEVGIGNGPFHGLHPQNLFGKPACDAVDLLVHIREFLVRIAAGQKFDSHARQTVFATGINGLDIVQFIERLLDGIDDQLLQVFGTGAGVDDEDTGAGFRYRRVFGFRHSHDGVDAEDGQEDHHHNGEPRIIYGDAW